jgi:hypothetical protein
MTYKRKVRTKFLKALRRIGWLCKKKTAPKHRIRISRTVYGDGTVEEHGIIYKAPENKQSFQSELHVYHEMKRDTEKKYNRPSKNK